MTWWGLVAKKSTTGRRLAFYYKFTLTSPYVDQFSPGRRISLIIARRHCTKRSIFANQTPNINVSVSRKRDVAASEELDRGSTNDPEKSASLFLYSVNEALILSFDSSGEDLYYLLKSRGNFASSRLEIDFTIGIGVWQFAVRSKIQEWLRWSLLQRAKRTSCRIDYSHRPLFYVSAQISPRRIVPPHKSTCRGTMKLIAVLCPHMRSPWDPIFSTRRYAGRNCRTSGTPSSSGYSGVWRVSKILDGNRYRSRRS